MKGLTLDLEKFFIDHTKSIKDNYDHIMALGLVYYGQPKKTKKLYKVD